MAKSRITSISVDYSDFAKGIVLLRVKREDNRNRKYKVKVTSKVLKSLSFFHDGDGYKVYTAIHLPIYPTIVFGITYRNKQQPVDPGWSLLLKR